MGVKVKLSKVRLTFPVLWEPKEYTPGDGKPRYSASFLVGPGSENDRAIRKAILEVATESANGDKEKAKKIVKSISGDSGKFCYQDGDLKEYDGYAGNWCLASHRRAGDGPPALVGRGGPKDVLTAADGLLVSGYYVNATVEIYYQTNKFPGVRATTMGIQFVEKGDVLAGSGTPADASEFEKLDAGGDDDFGDMDGTEGTGADAAEDDDGF